MRYLDGLIREMDRKIAKNKDRAEKESAPKELLPADRDRLADLKMRAKGEQLIKKGRPPARTGARASGVEVARTLRHTARRPDSSRVAPSPAHAHGPPSLPPSIHPPPCN